MTPILFMIGYFVGLVLTIFRHPIYGLYTYLFAFYLAPSYTWWRTDVADLRYMLIAGVVTIVASLRLPNDPQRAKWYKTGAGKLFLMFVLYNWLQVFWAIDRDMQIDGAVLYTKHLIVFYLIYRFANSLERIRDIAMVHIVGCAWFGYQALGAGGGRLETIGGAVAGSNELGVHVSTALLFGGILFLFLRGVQRAVIFGLLPLIANCLVLTISRGAFLGFFAGGAAGYIAMPSAFKRRYLQIGVLGLILLSMLAHEELIERFVETYEALVGEEKELDRSAAGRKDIALAGFRMALDYPLGAGHKATAILSPQYMDPSLLSKSGVRAAHNTFAAIVVEHGFPGLLLYSLTILWVLRTMMRMRRVGKSGEKELLGLSMAFTAASLVTVYVSGNFSNNVDLETQYWCLALLASLNEIQVSGLEKNARSDPASPVLPNKLIA